jgi:hypothetical protein
VGFLDGVWVEVLRPQKARAQDDGAWFGLRSIGRGRTEREKSRPEGRPVHWRGEEPGGGELKGGELRCGKGARFGKRPLQGNGESSAEGRPVHLEGRLFGADG